MKKLMALTICFILALSLGACEAKVTGNGSPIPAGSDMPEKGDAAANPNTDKIVDPSMPVPNEYHHKSYTYNTAFANWTDDSRIFSEALNTETMIISSEQHLPVYMLDTRAELDSFKNSFKNVLTMDQGLDEVPSFESITAAYDDIFFSKYSLMLAYVQASSGSFRFGISDVYIGEQSCCLYVEKLNNPEVYDCMMSGWFTLAEIDKDDIAECKVFDAQLVSSSDGTGEAVTQTASIRKDICELYLNVLEDLWNVDSGLNSEISQIGFDLSGLSHLTDEEKNVVMSKFASKHDLPYVAGTFEELCEQGLIDKENLRWEDGLFFSIKTNEDAEWNLPFIKYGGNPPELTSFDAHKWRSGLGAYFFSQCTAQKDSDGRWSYTVGQEAIA